MSKNDGAKSVLTAPTRTIRKNRIQDLVGPDIPIRRRPTMSKFKLSLRKSDDGGLLVSRTPGTDKLFLGQSLRELSDFVADPLFVQTEGETPLNPEAIRDFRKENTGFVDPKNLKDVSCSSAIKAWARERLPVLEIPYEISNRYKQGKDTAVSDEKASLKLVQLAEDFMLISKFCRQLQASHCTINDHAMGLEFLFEFIGPTVSKTLRMVENKGLDVLFRKYSSENSLRIRANVSGDVVEMQVVVLTPKIRMGMSPL